MQILTPTTMTPKFGKSECLSFIHCFIDWYIQTGSLSSKTMYLLGTIFLKTLKVSEYPFKQNKNTLKNIKVLLYTHFYNIFLNALRPTFFNIFNIPFSHFLNIRKIRVKVGPKTNYFSYFQSSCSGRIVVLNNFFSLIFNQPRDKQNRACNFLLFKYNLLLTVFMQNTLSKLVDLLQ